MIHYRIPGMFPARVLCGGGVGSDAQATIVSRSVTCPSCGAELSRQAAAAKRQFEIRLAAMDCSTAVQRAAIGRRAAARTEFRSTISWFLDGQPIPPSTTAMVPDETSGHGFTGTRHETADVDGPFSGGQP